MANKNTYQMNTNDLTIVKGEATSTRYGYALSWECPVYGVRREAHGEFESDSAHIYHDVVEDYTEIVLYRVKAEI